MTERVLKEYADYCENDGKKLYHLPFCIWLKYVYGRRQRMRRDEFPIVDKHVQNEINKVLDGIKVEIPKLACCENEYRQALVKVADVVKCIDKYRKEKE